MAEHLWSILCRKVIIDREDNTVSIHEAFEGVKFLDPIPAEAYKDSVAIISGDSSSAVMQLVTSWYRSVRSNPEKIEAMVRVVSPKGNTLLEQVFSVDLISFVKCRTIYNFTGFLYVGDGTYIYSVHQMKDGEWQTGTRLLFDVNID